MKLNTTFNLPVVLTSLLFCALILALVLFDTQQALAALNQAKAYIFSRFSWFYVLSSALFLFFLIFLALSRYGDIKLGQDDEEAEFGFGSWFALLFTAGMGIGIIFLGVAEPLAHFLSPLAPEEVTRSALFHSIFHWSVSAWAIYGLIALAIAYFGFRYKLPLSLRSCFYPLFKQKIDGKLGDLIDILGLCTTLFGVVTTLAYSAIRVSSALESIGLLSPNQSGVSFILIGVFVIAVLISLQGIAKGFRIISEFNLVLTIAFMLLILALAPTAYLLNAFTENIGFYLSSLIGSGFKTYVYEPHNAAWFSDWTVLYWAWWFSWAPAFGIFIARISRGRTIREFILGVLIVPSLFFILWFTVFGNGVIWVNQYLAPEGLDSLVNDVGKLLFTFLEYLPLTSLTQLMAFVIIVLFFITTIDFGIYILNNIASRDKSLVSPRWQAMMWGGIMAITTLVLLEIGGIDALQATMLIFSLPFVVLMLGMGVSLLKGVRMDYAYFHQKFNQTSLSWTPENWKTRLDQMINQTDEQDMFTFLKHIALPAMRELRQELIGRYELNVHIEAQWELPQPKLVFQIDSGSVHPFIYGIHLSLQETLDEQEERTEILVPMTFFNHQEKSYDVEYFNKNQLIADILQQYENYLKSIQEIEAA
ncbi:choline transporter [Pasteurellaceae bacterium RH1A]|nr:choline transporter [Pasteurellaceae bacterium RH1A]